MKLRIPDVRLHLLKQVLILRFLNSLFQDYIVFFLNLIVERKLESILQMLSIIYEVLPVSFMLNMGTWRLALQKQQRLEKWILINRTFPFLFFGAGLPQIAKLAGEAKSYAERLFDFKSIGKLEPKQANNDLDSGFYKVRYERLTVRQQQYVIAMAKTPSLPAKSGVIAKIMKIPVKKAAPIRDELIKKGMIYSPAFGLTTFTVPKFDAFLQRTVLK